ncbi:MAG: 2-oxoacid:ferredoxin oxidoreductase subunit beta [Candidatus Cyclonatronum sp.]|uniref:2-oxoacid:ferredoxin oxidoreductase subunit beta n=1 Tax=Cyclonatronum sp. TaxID=3024185 RepID=UPI0025C1F57D|nr:2-oxoacid:ferredoxin oxidoreductase subunit beta [Cyclonatronum sp.]MCH8487507.1 2-oxoacid:ferredoxin oxidoreductase subunit beta [Cyclonatronum sp.]
MVQKTASTNGSTPALKPKDFASDQDVRWCPGCGDYTILKQVQNVMPELGVPRENIVFVAGIGCSSRFPYYMDTFGMHSIHGRAPSIATGLKASRPELSVWVITGDGDALSIGGNHLIHVLRRNVDLNILLFNNEIYGLTKGQYSPTSHEGTVTKSTPMGSLDHPFNPAALAMGANACFFARAMDRDPKHLNEMLIRTHQHKGASLLEIYQNCIVFNDGAFEVYTDKQRRSDTALYLEHGKPLVFGKEGEKGIRLDGTRPELVKLGEGEWSESDLWVHDEKDAFKAYLLARFFEDNRHEDRLPRPFGVFLDVESPAYDEIFNRQIEQAYEKKGKGDLDALLAGEETWVVK